MSRPELYVVNEVAVVETGPDKADVLSVPEQGPPGVSGATGVAGPNLITDTTALGTLTAIADPAFLLVGAAAGDRARKLAPTPWGLSNLLASVPAGRVPYADGSGLVTSNAGLVFDAGTNGLTVQSGLNLKYDGSRGYVEAAAPNRQLILAPNFGTVKVCTLSNGDNPSVVMGGGTPVVRVRAGMSYAFSSNTGSADIPADTELTRSSAGFVGIGSPSNKVVIGHDGTDGLVTSSTGLVRVGRVSVLGSAGNTQTCFTGTDTVMWSGANFGWANTNSASTLTPLDTGLARDSAGTVRVTNGSTGVGNLIAGNLSARGGAIDLSPASSGGVGLNGSSIVSLLFNANGSNQRMGFIGGANLVLASGCRFGFGNASTVASNSSPDAAFRRSSANVIDLDTGTDGAFGDLRLRVLHVTGGTVASFTPTVGNRPRTVLTQGSSAFALMSGPIDGLSVAPLGTYSTRTGIALGGCTSLTYGDNWFSASARRAGGVADSQGGGWSQGSWYFELGRVSDGAAGAFVVGNNHASATGNFQRQWYSHPGNLVFCRFTSTTDRESAAIQNAWADSTDATRTGRLLLSVYSTTTPQEGIRIDANSGGVRLGFYGATAVARPTLPDAGTVTAADIRTALISLGLCQ